jgi:sterol desaturase/sphingolipid hydroxylase (fatty acid hydroxylase superfamily)
MWAVLLVGFVVRDFVQWWTHRLLHFSPRLWEFHKVHHSVKEMGFAAHLRYHWMETVVYRSIEYIPLALLGVGLHDFFLIHIFTLAWGHYNHANFRVNGRVTGSIVAVFFGLIVLTTGGFDVNSTSVLLTIGIGLAVGALLLGPVMKYLFNSPEMHIWHHVHDLPKGYNHGINFGITLAIWDYIFGTASVPKDGRDIELGFPGDQEFPETFWGQIKYGFSKFRKA